MQNGVGVDGNAGQAAQFRNNICERQREADKPSGRAVRIQVEVRRARIQGETDRAEIEVGAASGVSFLVRRRVDGRGVGGDVQAGAGGPNFYLWRAAAIVGSDKEVEFTVRIAVNADKQDRVECAGLRQV